MIIKETTFGYVDGPENYTGIVKMHKGRFQYDYDIQAGKSTSPNLATPPEKECYIIEVKSLQGDLEYQVISLGFYLQYQQNFKDKFNTNGR